jgi:hypothetical protein
MDAKFKPDFTPLQMLRLGVFGGTYFESDIAEYPISWQKAIAKHEVKGAAHNMFGVLSGQSLKVWQDKGWIHPQDPRGWLQWYCRYYMGRRTVDDARQIARHHAFKRHVAQLIKHGDRLPSKRHVQRQAVLQWGYNPIPENALPSRLAYKYCTVLKANGVL